MVTLVRALPPQEASPDAPSPTTACKNKLHKSFHVAKLQVGTQWRSNTATH